MLDLPGLQRAADRAAPPRAVAWSRSRRRPPRRSPSSLLFDYVATYMYEGDTPNAERRAAALSLDRDLLRELLGQEELRDLIDPGGARRRSRPTSSTARTARSADSRDALADVLRRLGDLTLDEVARPRPRRARRRAAAARRSARSAARCALRVDGEARWIAADDAGPVPRRARRRAAGRAARGVRRRRARRAASARRALRAHARAVHRPTSCATATASIRPRSLREARARRRARPRRAAPRRHASASGATPRCCAGCAARRSRCCARRSRPPTSARWPRSCRRGRASTAIPRAGAGIDRLREVLVPLQGLALPAEVWERDVLPRRTGAVLADVAGPAVRQRRGGLGRRRRARAQLRPRRALLPRRRRADRPADEQVRARRRCPSTTRSASGSPQSPCFFTDLLAELPLSARGDPGGAVGPRLGGRGDQRRVRAAARAAADAAPGAARASTGRGPAAGSARAAAGAGATVQGRWSLTTTIFRQRARPRPAPPARAPSCCSSATASSPASTCSPRASPAASACSTTRFGALETLGVCRRGYFIEGLGGAQFALPGAVERLRAQQADDEAPPIVLAATDPAQPYGAALPWPKRDGETPSARSAPPARTSSSPAASRSLYVERGGRGICSSLAEPDDPRVRPRSRRSPRSSPPTGAASSSLERIDGEPVVGLALGAAADRARLPPGPAQAHAERLTRIRSKAAPTVAAHEDPRRHAPRPRTAEHCAAPPSTPSRAS